jgi:1-acyl-sn-glycerol-3-phosphate acyltransferase
LAFWQIVLFISYLFSPTEETINNIAVLMAKSCCFLCGVKTNISGLEKINPNNTYVYVSNHQSIFDIIGLWAVFPYKFRWISKKEVLKIPVISWGIYKGGHIVFDRSSLEEAKQSVSMALEKIKRGNSIIVFPEGTRSEDGNIQNFKKGAFLMAFKANVPVVPIIIKGSNKIKPKKGFAIHSGTIDIKILDPITIDNESNIYPTITKIRSEMIQNLT